MSKKQLSLEFSVKKWIKQGYSISELLKRAVREFSELDILELEREIKHIVDNYGDYVLIQKIIKGKLIREMDGRSLIILDPSSNTARKISREHLYQILDPKLDISDKFYTCEHVYNPFKLEQLFKSEYGDWQYNAYIPPLWQADHFYSGGKKEIEKLNLIPKLYHDFFMHLVDNDERSYSYLIKWLANAVQYRNFCILTLIGEQGVGKGRLAEVLKILFGKHNYQLTSKRILKSDFNGQTKNKRLLSINEASVKTDDQEERIKVLVDNELEIEAKGKDAEQVDNYASVMFSSNSYDSVRLEEQDRRFSIINLTRTKIKDVWEFERMSELTKEASVWELAKFLYHYPVDQKEMLNVFRCAHTEKIRESGLYTWQSWFLDEYCVENAGKTIKLDEVSDTVTTKYGSKFTPHKAAFEKLEAVYPKKFKVYRPIIDGKQVNAIKFAEKDIK